VTGDGEAADRERIGERRDVSRPIVNARPGCREDHP